jgi:beta-glucosidase
VSESDLPAFQNETFEDVEYNYYHGYRYFEHEGIAPQYPFGFGLSYTTFEYSNLQLSSDTIAEDGTLTVTVDVTNTGPVAGSEVVQAYVGFDNTGVDDEWGRPHKVLQGFARAEDIEPDATETVTIEIEAQRLGYWSVDDQAFVVERMTHELYVGPSSDESDPNMLVTTFEIQ